MMLKDYVRDLTAGRNIVILFILNCVYLGEHIERCSKVSVWI